MAMNSPVVPKITDYIRSQPRNKIVFYSNEIPPGLTPLNMGYTLAESIYNFNDLSKLPMRVSVEVDAILQGSVKTHEVWGKVLAISNVGILFEPELKLDFNRLLDNYSQNNVLFAEWKGEISNEHIYFLTKENGIKTTIKNLSHIAI